MALAPVVMDDERPKPAESVEVAEVAQRLIEDDTPDEEPVPRGDGNEIRAVLRSVPDSGDIDDLDTLLACLSLLEPRQVMVLVQRYGLDGGSPMRQVEIGARLGISASQVGRIEKTAIEELCQSAAAELLLELM